MQYLLTMHQLLSANTHCCRLLLLLLFQAMPSAGLACAWR
jgi:hypothetical protein